MKSFKDYAKILEELTEIDSKNLNIRFKEVAEVDHKAEEIFIKPLMEAHDNTWSVKDDFLGEMANAYESAGFIVGFMRAMHLMYKATEAQEEAKAV